MPLVPVAEVAVLEIVPVQDEMIVEAYVKPTEIAFLYIAKTKASFEEIEKGMKRTLKKVDSGHTEIPK